MKKTTLYKLVKQALREVFFEDKDKGNNQIRLSPKLNKILSEKFTSDEKSELLIYLNKDKTPILEEISKSQARKIYSFLVKNSEENIPLAKIARNSLLKNIEISVIEVIYPNILEISLEEFLEIIGEFTSGSSSTSNCAGFTHPDGTTVGQKDYGTQTIYNGCIPQTINDGFICCSNTNDNTPTQNEAYQSPFVILATTEVGSVSVLGNLACVDPTSLDNPTGGQFTFNDFETYAIDTAAGGLGAINITSLDNQYFSITSADASGCGGCAHNLSLNYAGTSTAPAGCHPGNGAFDQTDLSCCEFTGCGAVQTIPAASNITSDSISTNGTNLTAVANETFDYWTDNGSCNFEVDCAQVNITIGSTQHQTTNYDGTTQVIGGPNPNALGFPDLPNYDYQGISTNPSPYHFNTSNVTAANPSLCNITVCADPDLDPSGTNATLLASQGQTNFVALANTYGSGTSQYTVTASTVSGACTMTACTDPTAANWANPTLFPNVDITADNANLCVPEITGCGTATTTVGNNWTNYNLGGVVTINDNTCEFEGCTDQLTGGTSLNYVCTLHDWMCLENASSTTVCDSTIHNTTLCVPNTTLPEVANNLTPFPHNQQLCTGLVGCTDSGTNQNQAWWTGTNLGGYDYSDVLNTNITTYPNGALGQPNFYDSNATQENGTCNYNIDGCTYADADNYETSLTNTTIVEDASCEFEYCMDNTTLNYFCVNYGGLCDVPGPTGTPDTPTLLVSVTPNNSLCSYTQVDGCMDNTSTGGQTFTTNTGAIYTNTAATSNTQTTGACNYLASANNDDGTHCTYMDNLCNCAETITGNQTGYCDCDGTENFGCCPSSDSPDCNGDCGGSATYGCSTNNSTGAYSFECRDGNTAFTSAALDCNSTCGIAELDDCGFCHSLGLANTTDPINTCHGCMLLEDSAGNYDNAHTSDPNNECVFSGYCTTANNSFLIPSLNYICETNPNLCYASGGSSGTSAYGDNTFPCISSYNTCTPDTDLGTWGTSTGCTYGVVGCMDDGSSNTTWGTVGPFVTTTSPATGNNTGAATNYNSNATIVCDGTNSSEPIANGPDGVAQTLTINPQGVCCSYNPGCTHPGYVNYSNQYTQDDGVDGASSSYCGFPTLDGCMNPIMDNYDPSATSPGTTNTCKYTGCVDNGDNNDNSPSNNDSLWNDYICNDQALLNNPNFDVVLDTSTTIPAGQDEPKWKWAGCSQLGLGEQFDLSYGLFLDINGSTVVYDSSNSTNIYDPNDFLSPSGTQFGSCQFPSAGVDGCTTPDYIQNDGSTLTTLVPPNFQFFFTNPLGDCEFDNVCDDPLASNYFCVDNPLLCDMSLNNGAGAVNPSIGGLNINSSIPNICQNINYPTYDCGPDGIPNPTGGANITPLIGCQENTNGTGQYTGATAFADCQAVCKSCTEVTAKKCNGTTIRNYTCDGQGGSDGLTIDGFEGNHTGAPGQIWINTVTAPYFLGQRFKVKEKMQPAPNDYTPKQLEEQYDPSDITDVDFSDPSIYVPPTNPPPKPDIGVYGSLWVSYEVIAIREKFTTNPTRKEGKGTQCFPLTYDCRCLSSPCPEGGLGATPGGGHKHYCTPNTSGTGASATLGECLKWCPCEASGRYTPKYPWLMPSAKKVDSCPGHTGRDILPKSCDNAKYYPDKERPDIEEPEVKEPTTDKPIDIDTVEPIDIDRPTEPTGSADVPERPTITPDTPELKESKKLRKLIKKWKRNNL